MAVIQGGTSGNLAEVDANNRIKMNLAGADVPAQVGAIRSFSENDPGTITGTAYLASPETDDDYRLRVSQEVLLDFETFNYTAQNTGKHLYRTTTLTNAWGTNGLTTNSGNVNTSGSGTSFATLAEFPIAGASILYCEMEASLSGQAPANLLIDWGLFRNNTSTPFAPTDGVMFRLTSAGIFGVINSNGSEVTTSPFTFTWVNNTKYQFIIAMHEREVEFWINNVLYGTLVTPIGQGQPCMSASLPLAVRHAHVGTAGAVVNFVLNDYAISIGGTNISSAAHTVGNRALGSYQGLSGGTMGSLASYANSTNPTAAAPANAALTANLPNGLGGQGLVTAAAVAVTDGIWGAYFNPVGTVSVQGKRLVVKGVIVDAVNTGAAVAATATTIQFCLGFGFNTAANPSMVATDTGTSQLKGARRVALGYMTWPVGAAIGQGPQAGPIKVDFSDAPIYVNPGEWLMLTGKFIVGTATASQTINFVWQPIYGWE